MQKGLLNFLSPAHQRPSFPLGNSGTHEFAPAVPICSVPRSQNRASGVHANLPQGAKSTKKKDLSENRHSAKVSTALRRLRLSFVLLCACLLLPACATSSAPAGKPDEAYVKAAWAYFKNKCDTEAGEKIYKTFTGVKNVLVVKPLPPATEKDLYDQFWYGDPYSDDLPVADRGERSAALLIGRRPFVQQYAYANRGLDFVEMQVGKESKGFLRLTPLTDPPYVAQTIISRSASRFGISWEDISTPADRKYWVAGSRLRVVDLQDNSIVAERIGFLIEAGFGSTDANRRPWMTTRGPNTACPAIINRDHANRFFILKVLRTSEGESDRK